MSSTHTNPSSNDELDFVDISIEQFREYELAGGETYRIDNPVALFVREESGNHRILARREDGQYVSHHVSGDGQRPIKWVVEPGEKFFLGWGPAAAENTPAPEVQPFPEEAANAIRDILGIREPARMNFEVTADLSPQMGLTVHGGDWGESGSYAVSEIGKQLHKAVEDLGGAAVIRANHKGFSVEKIAQQ